MTTIKTLAIGFTVLSSHAFAKNAELKTENRTSNEFHYIEIKGDMNVSLIQNTKPGIELKGTEQQILSAVTLLKNDTLFIYSTLDKKVASKLSLRINVDNLNGLSVDGMTTVTTEGNIRSGKFSIKSEGGSVVNIDMNSEKDLEPNSKEKGAW